MRSQWEALHSGLVRTIDTSAAKSIFQEMRAVHEALTRFDSPLSVVAYLTRDASNLDEKDRILTTLVGAVGNKRSSNVSLTLLFLGLWPGLDGIYRRRLSCFRGAPEALESELADRFTREVQRFDPARVTRVAATLVRSTEREVIRARVRELKIAARNSDQAVDDLPAPTAESFVSSFGIAPAESDDQAAAVLERWLKEVVGGDAELVADAILRGRCCNQLAVGLGISPAATRKRLQRALARARRMLNSQNSQSQSGARVAFTRS